MVEVNQDAIFDFVVLACGGFKPRDATVDAAVTQLADYQAKAARLEQLVDALRVLLASTDFRYTAGRFVFCDVCERCLVDGKGEEHPHNENCALEKVRKLMAAD